MYVFEYLNILLQVNLAFIITIFHRNAFLTVFLIERLTTEDGAQSDPNQYVCLIGPDGQRIDLPADRQQNENKYIDG